ncbi:MAG: hypothetical protein ACN6NZ_03970, partial [Burkholderiales bacterium]
MSIAVYLALIGASEHAPPAGRRWPDYLTPRVELEPATQAKARVARRLHSDGFFNLGLGKNCTVCTLAGAALGAR